jgi:hypothetical protein
LVTYFDRSPIPRQPLRSELNTRSTCGEALLSFHRFEATIYECGALPQHYLFAIGPLGAVLLSNLFGTTLLSGFTEFRGYLGWINQLLRVNRGYEAERNQHGADNHNKNLVKKLRVSTILRARHMTSRSRKLMQNPARRKLCALTLAADW